MSTKCSTSARDISWNWVIEALAYYEQLDSSTLVGLMKNAPAILNDTGKDAREMVSLKILESMFVHGKEASVDTASAHNDKIHFDPSERCEDVLRKMLDETSKSERQKRDFSSFIMHKRSSLADCFLKKLKEAIIEGSHPLLASLEERSKLNPENENNKFQENPLRKGDQLKCSNGETTRREECEMSKEPPVEGVNEIPLIGLDEHDEHENPLRKSDQLKCSNGETTRREECEMSKEPPVEGVNEIPLKDLDELDASKNHDQKQLPGVDENVPQDTSRMNNLEFVANFEDPKNSVQENVSNGGHSTEARNSILHDGGISDDERVTIAAKKVAFLSSQSSLGQDSMAMADWTEIDLCTKCNERGELLVCSSDACPIRVHESCLHSVATFDENGKFLCPFCAYSRAISKYVEVKKTTSLARKELQAFLGFGVNKRPKISMERSDLVKNGSRETRVLDEANGNKEKGVSRGDKGVSIVNQDLKEVEKEGSKVIEECQSPTRMEEEQPSSETVSSIRSKSPSSIGNENDIGSIDSRQKVIPQPSSPKQKRKKKGSATSTASTPSRSLRKRKARSISPALPLLRRNVLPWTKSEEEILKEGVKKFSSVKNKGIPWTEILDFGREVFHKGRTAIDLKDKWRNICKGSPKSK